MELILIRHLKTPGNEKRQYIGSTDEELSEQEVLNFKQKYKMDSYPPGTASDCQPNEEMYSNGRVDLSEEPDHAGSIVKGM